MNTPGGRPGARTNTCADTAESSAGQTNYQALPRCVACLTQVSRLHDTHCRTCLEWGVAYGHLRQYISLSRFIVGVSK
jgi:hypothetical protein